MKLTGLSLLIVVGSIWLQPAAGQVNLPLPAGLQTNHKPGYELYKRLSCHGCHALNGRGGRIGPGLDGVGRRLAREDLETQLLTPRKRRADSRMPSFAFIKPGELHQLLDFLQSLP